MRSEQFLGSIRSFRNTFDEVKIVEERLVAALDRLDNRLVSMTDTRRPATRTQFEELTRNLRTGIVRSLKKWKDYHRDRVPVQELSDRFQDRPIILVFGKVNSGKSTFINFLVDELKQFGAEAVGFVVKDGTIMPADPRFETGITETTFQIQGVAIDQCLTLIDSPGLHSVTDANDDLARRYADAADSIVWLTPSSQPGQIQELSDLKEELEQKKPLQPIITKSDRLEEWCEQGEIHKKLRNKSTQERSEQEDYVRKAAQESNLIEEIRSIVSISILVYRELKTQARADWDDAGLGRLFGRLDGIVNAARGYKVDKARQLMQKYIKEVLGELQDTIEPGIEKLRVSTKRRIGNLTGRQPTIVSEVKSRVMAAFTDRIVEKHRSSKNIDAIRRDFNDEIDKQIAEVARSNLKDYVSDVEESLGAVARLASVSSDDLGEFDEVTVGVPQTKGRAAQSISASVGGIGGGAGGAALGSLIFPGVGTIVGGIVGALLGSWGGTVVGEEFVEEDLVHVHLGYSVESLVESAKKSAGPVIEEKVEALVESVVEVCRSAEWFADEVKLEIERFKKEIA